MSNEKLVPVYIMTDDQKEMGLRGTSQMIQIVIRRLQGIPFIDKYVNLLQVVRDEIQEDLDVIKKEGMN